MALCDILIASFPDTGSLYVALYLGYVLEIVHNKTKKNETSKLVYDRDINRLKHLKYIMKIFCRIFRIYINNLMNEDSIGPLLLSKDMAWSNNLRFLKIFIAI